MTFSDKITAQAVLAASFLAGARDENILAIVDSDGASGELKRYLSIWKWAVHIIKNPWEVLSEIYRMIRYAEVSA